MCVLKVILKPFSVSRTLMSKANFLTCFVSKSSPPFISSLENGTTFADLRHCQKHESESSIQYALFEDQNGETLVKLKSLAKTPG